MSCFGVCLDLAVHHTSAQYAHTLPGLLKRDTD